MDTLCRIRNLGLLQCLLIPLILAANNLPLPGNGPSGRGYGSSGTMSTGGISNGTGSQTANPGFPTSNKGCFPNIVNNTVANDKFKKLGEYYEYRSKAADQQVYNAMFTNSLVGNGKVYLPGTTTPAVHYTQIYQRTTISYNANKCNNQNIDILSKPTGVDTYFTFDSDSAPAVPVYQVAYTLYDDAGSNGFEIAYICDTPNYTTGICEDVELYVNARLHPNKMTDAQKKSIDDVVSKTLKPYCLSLSDLQRPIFRDDLPTCNAASNLVAAFNNLVAGFQSSVPTRA